uniref:Uncharacterized protein n=1 Tax=Romanomermis culicivorax TaxID=13658 RepID=A0A915KUM8_ROMCU
MVPAKIKGCSSASPMLCQNWSSRTRALMALTRLGENSLLKSSSTWNNNLFPLLGASVEVRLLRGPGPGTLSQPSNGKDALKLQQFVVEGALGTPIVSLHLAHEPGNIVNKASKRPPSISCRATMSGLMRATCRAIFSNPLKTLMPEYQTLKVIKRSRALTGRLPPPWTPCENWAKKTTDSSENFSMDSLGCAPFKVKLDFGEILPILKQEE